MPGTSPEVASQPAPRAGPGHRLVAIARRLWHGLGALAETLSDAGHGPRRWRERSDVPNPYAGVGPIAPDDRHPDD
jgi:hypothetical protein